jgi:hypothetical protein
MQRGCLLNACRGKHTLIILSEEGTLGVQEGDGDNNSFSLGTDQRTQSLNGKKKKDFFRVLKRVVYLFPESTPFFCKSNRGHVDSVLFTWASLFLGFPFSEPY